MVRTTHETFRKELLETGGYRTADDHRAAARRAPGALTTFGFSWAVGRVFPLSAFWEAFRALTVPRWERICFSAITVPESYGMTVTIEGFGERSRHRGPVMYLCNHMSTYETIALPPILLTFGPFSFVAKQSLAHLPALERAAAKMGMVGIGRKNPKEDLLKLYDVGCRRIAEGQSFLVFPQGTRQPVFSRRHFSSIGAKLAEKAGVPIVPIVIDSRCLPTRSEGMLARVFKDFGPVDTSRDIRIAAGPVIPCGKSREMHERCFAWMADKLESWGLPTERS